ncbi:MAG: hypothetical protein ACRERU_13605 [Methylococcales bacterium]
MQEAHIISSLLTQYPQTQLSHNLELQMAGRIANTTELGRLKSQLETLAPIKVQHADVKTDLALLCNPLALFRKHQKPEKPTGGKLSLRFNNPDSVYRNGEYLVLTVENNTGIWISVCRSLR